MLTKKRLARLSLLITAVYFALILTLPDGVTGPRAESEHMLLYVFKIGFLSVSAAITTAVILVFLFKRDFLAWQSLSFGRYKHLLRLLVKRDFITRYRKSVLGVLWSLLHPLLIMLVMTLVFSQLFRFEIPFFPVYMLSGQIIFGFFNEATTRAMTSIIAGEGIIKKVYVPKYIFPVSNILSSLVNLVFSLIAFILVFIITRAPFYPTMFLIPIPIIYVFVFSLGVGMILSSMAVFFRDLTYLYGIFITLIMYLTPLFYPIEIIPDRFRPFMGINPLYQYIDYFRSLALRGVIPGLWTNAVCAGLSLTALVLGVYVFMSQQDKYILYI